MRWDGLRAESTKWDGLRRVSWSLSSAGWIFVLTCGSRQDPELWFPDGNCLVYLYGRGQSRRGPSLRIPYHAIRTSNCGPLLDTYLADFHDESISENSDDATDDGGFFGNPSIAGQFELYIPVPSHYKREEAFSFHLTTRNFFAWMFGKPLVGPRLGEALLALLRRMDEFRSQDADNIDDILHYMEEEGYIDLKCQPNNALAVLFFAEHAQLPELWTEAFVHCVGMNDILIKSTEYEVSYTSVSIGRV